MTDSVRSERRDRDKTGGRPATVGAVPCILATGLSQRTGSRSCDRV